MNKNQEKRFDKLSTDRFYLLKHKIYDDLLEFHISGSTKNVYKVMFYTNTGKVFCTCPDAKSWAVKCKCVCKHALFVLYRVLKVFVEKDQPFFQTLVLTETELVDIFTATENLYKNLDATVIDRDLTSKFNYLENKPQEEHYFDPKDLCGVCFLDFIDEPEHKTCPKCHKASHNECIDKWINSGNKICVYCRQDVWERKEKDGYKNLS